MEITTNNVKKEKEIWVASFSTEPYYKSQQQYGKYNTNTNRYYYYTV